VWLRVGAARADEPSGEPFRFVWVRAENADGCSSDAQMASAVSKRLGRTAFSDHGTRSIEGVVHHDGDVWEAYIYLRDAKGNLEGSRALRARSPTCAPIEAAASLAIALTIDSEAALGSPVSAAAQPALPEPVTPPPAASATPTTCAPAAAVRTPPLLPATPPPQPTRWGVVAFRVAASVGLLPSVSPAFALAAQRQIHAAVHATAGLLYLPEQQASDGRFAFGMTAGWLGACVVPVDVARTSWSLCVKAEGGGIHPVVRALEPLSPGERPWVAGSVETVLRGRIAGPLLAEVGADLVVPFTRDRFVLEPPPATTVFQQAKVAGAFFIGVGMLFP
jgi:hypothetical protein